MENEWNVILKQQDSSRNTSPEADPGRRTRRLCGSQKYYVP